MKQTIENLIKTALTKLQKEGALPSTPVQLNIDATRDKQFGDYASNIALILAKPAQKKPREIAELILQAIPASSSIEKIEIAGPGFLNFFLSKQALSDVVSRILSEKENFGRSKMGREKKVILDFLSSNPTGPLHVGHGRIAAFGAVVANLLDAVGFKIYREYYINDAGRQMDILAVSVWMRYLSLCGETIEFPANGYRGGYVVSIAKAIMALHHHHFQIPTQTIFADLPPDEPQGGDKEHYIDALIERSKKLLGDKYQAIFDLALENILADIREDLTEFNVHYDNWFSEREMITHDLVNALIQKLKEKDCVYESEGALWFRAMNFGDVKDRVLIRANGQRTYFANDVAYHLNKFERGFDIALDIFGSDHHGYIMRIKATMQALGIDPERLMNLLVQFVTLYRGGEQVSMSTRGGKFVTLRELRDEVGNDAARFFYVMRKCEQHMDFDLDLAKAQSNENPVYYVQYAYARIASVFKQLSERKLTYREEDGLAHVDLLTQPHEMQLLNTLSRYPDMIISAALSYEPHQLTIYLRELATDFHAYYNSHQFIVEEESLRNARLALIKATQQTLLNGFKLLGISALETM